MPDMVIYVPMSRKLYNDIVRFSDGKLDPPSIAENLLTNWVGSELEFGSGAKHFGDRFEDAVAEYAPHLLETLAREEEAAFEKSQAERKPLVWKEVSISTGSEVRMFYGGEHHYAIVRNGFIVENDGKRYSPSEWASKVAGGTSRNAWRDLWFREPLAKTWVPAQLLRDLARKEVGNRQKSIITLDDIA